MPCHVIITTVLDCWEAAFESLEVKPLSPDASLQLIERIAGSELAQHHGSKLVELASGLPVQLVPQSATLVKAARRRGSQAHIALTLTQEARQSFGGVYEQLDQSSRLLLHTAARLNCQRIVRNELKHQLVVGAGWAEAEFEHRLDDCLDVYVLQGIDEIRMHQLFAAFVRDVAPCTENVEVLERIVSLQFWRMFVLASKVINSPNNADLVAAFMTYSLDLMDWNTFAIRPNHRTVIGGALLQLGQFTNACAWLEQPVGELGDADGDVADVARSLTLFGRALLARGELSKALPVLERAARACEMAFAAGKDDYAMVAATRHDVGLCLNYGGEIAAARLWFERAAEAHETAQSRGQGDRAEFGNTLFQVGLCFWEVGDFSEARPWFERALMEMENGLRGLDHTNISTCVQLLADCILNAGEFEKERALLKRGVTDAEKGDIRSYRSSQE
jgi:tetratricopeptide (TPR) repeat protein